MIKIKNVKNLEKHEKDLELPPKWIEILKNILKE